MKTGGREGGVKGNCDFSKCSLIAKNLLLLKMWLADREKNISKHRGDTSQYQNSAE